jgi:fermentation-respiration switch protein FrsA (DUF1100 family)
MDPSLFRRGACLVACFLWCAGCATGRYHDAYLLLDDVADAGAVSRLERSTAEPSRTPISYTIEGRASSGDLYLPGEGVPEAGVVLVPGAVPEGKDHESLVGLARTLARVRFAVLTPDLSGYRELKIRPDQIREVADAFRYLVEHQELAPAGRAGIGAFSFAVGPAVLATLEQDIRDRVRFVFGVGAYHDLRHAIRFFTTGYFEEEGELRSAEFSEYGRLVFAKSVQDQLRDPTDRATLEVMVEEKMKNPAADLSALAGELGPEGQSVYHLLTNADPERTPALISGLPEETVAMIDALRARLILVHGKNDELIPYTESIALAGAAAPSRSRVIIVNNALGHVDLRFSGLLSAQFWTQELPDAFRVLRAVAILMREREPASVSAPSLDRSGAAD